MSLSTLGWTMEVERGPDWLFVRLHAPGDPIAEEVGLADGLWAILEQHFTYRLVLELDDVQLLRSWLIGQMILLHKRIHTRGGLLRLSGLSEGNCEALRATRLEGQLPHYRTRAEAVSGFRPMQPR